MEAVWDDFAQLRKTILLLNIISFQNNMTFQISFNNYLKLVGRIDQPQTY